MRIGFLLGAGCPLSVRDGSQPLIPDIAGLTKIVRQDLDSDDKTISLAVNIWERAVSRGIASPTVEDILSHIRILKSLSGTKGVDGFSTEDLSELDQLICATIRKTVSRQLPKNSTPYHTLASWIQAISRDYPVEIFTTNYDELVEQAFENQGVPYFDGFVGSFNAFLDLDSMQDNVLPARWARLWKVHGSVNWWLTKDKQVRRTREALEGEQLLIYPSHLKYDQSREMPYLAMLDRLRAFLRSQQSVIVTCGYSFADEHINAYIAQGLAANSNASCLALIYGDLSTVPHGTALAKRHANLSVLAADGAVVGTVERPWLSDDRDNHPAYAICISKDIQTSRSQASAEQCKWLLGDFSVLGRLLASQLSGRVMGTEDVDAK